MLIGFNELIAVQPFHNHGQIIIGLIKQKIFLCAEIKIKMFNYRKNACTKTDTLRLIVQTSRRRSKETNLIGRNWLLECFHFTFLHIKCKPYPSILYHTSTSLSIAIFVFPMNYIFPSLPRIV